MVIQFGSTLEGLFVWNFEFRSLRFFFKIWYLVLGIFICQEIFIKSDNYLFKWRSTGNQDRRRTVRTDNLDQSRIGIIVEYAATRIAAGKLHNNLLFRVVLRPPWNLYERVLLDAGPFDVGFGIIQEGGYLLNRSYRQLFTWIYGKLSTTIHSLPQLQKTYQRLRVQMSALRYDQTSIVIEK